MFKVTNFRAIVGKNGASYVLCGSSTPNLELEAKGIKNVLKSSAGFLEFTDQVSANAAVSVLQTLDVQLKTNAKGDGFDVVVL